MQGFEGEVAQQICLAYEFLVDDYGLDRKDHREGSPLYIEAGISTDPDAISRIYIGVDMFKRVVKFYFSKRMQPLPPSWGIRIYDRVPMIGACRFALYTTCLSYGL